jgi:undecaprenyl-diphosphatase
MNNVNALVLGRTMALSAAIMALLALVVGNQWHPVLTLDDGIAVAGHQATAGHDLLIATWSAVSHWGGPEYMRQLMVLVAVGLVLGRRFVAGAWLAGLAVLESFAAPAAKLLLERPRPSWTDPITTAGATSFPSGHATAVATAAVALLLVTFGLVRSQRVRRAALAVAAVTVAAVCASRIFLGVHFFSDIIGGIAFGTLLVMSTAWVVEMVRPGFLSVVADGAAVGQPEANARRGEEQDAEHAEGHHVVAGSLERDPVLLSRR